MPILFSGYLSLVRGYLHHWLHALNEHSLHAPLVYDLYCNVIKKDQVHPLFHPIENVRCHLLRCPDQVLVSNLGAPSRVSRQPSQSIRSVARHGLSSPKFGRLLYRLASYNSSDCLVELGTSLGISALYLATARPLGTVYTLEGSSALADRAEQIFCAQGRSNIHLVRGNIDHTLPNLLRQLPQVDFAYLDANHRYAPTVAYFEQLVTKTNESSIIVIDDIYWSGEMQRAWRRIRQHPAVTLTIDLFDVGLVFFAPLTMRQHYLLMF